MVDGRICDNFNLECLYFQSIFWLNNTTSSGNNKNWTDQKYWPINYFKGLHCKKLHLYVQDNIAIHTQLTVPAMVPAVDHVAASIERPLSSLFFIYVSNFTPTPTSLRLCLCTFLNFFEKDHDQSTRRLYTVESTDIIAHFFYHAKKSARNLAFLTD